MLTDKTCVQKQCTHVIFARIGSLIYFGIFAHSEAKVVVLLTCPMVWSHPKWVGSPAKHPTKGDKFPKL